MRKAIFQSGVSLFAISSLIFGRLISYPDNVHTVHGLPLTWGAHQLVTIIGPVDTWRVNIVNLSIDLVFWLGLVILTPLIMEKINQN